jgi:hypothetical protein
MECLHLNIYKKKKNNNNTIKKNTYNIESYEENGLQIL